MSQSKSKNTKNKFESSYKISFFISCSSFARNVFFTVDANENAVV